jgi:hypothetical protein
MTMSVERNLVGAIAGASQRFTTLNVDFVTADEIGVTYDLMPAPRPNDADAVVALWQGTQIPWDGAPLATHAIGSQQHGSQSFTGLTVGRVPYIIGLAVGPLQADTQKARNVVASACIPNEDDPAVTDCDSLTLKFVGATSVALQFSCLAGFRPQTNGAWVGIWRGEAASYFRPPDASAAIKVDTNFGIVAINNFAIGMGLIYTIGLFTTGWADDPIVRHQKVLVSSLTFVHGKS